MLLLAVVGIGYVVHSLANGFRYGSYTCLPSDFPRYPGATFAGQLYQIGGTHPGHTCHIVFESNDDVETVTAFYQSKLNTGDWVTSSGNPAGQVSFQLAKNTQPFGTIHVAASTTHTEITIDVFSSTCLLRNFPLYPGAKFAGQNYQLNGSQTCHVVFETNDDVATVNAFYEKKLNTGNWEVTSRTAGQVGFVHKTGNKKGIRFDAVGTVNIAVSGEHTDIKIDAF